MSHVLTEDPVTDTTDLGKGERNYIMQVVCEATQNSTVQVQVGAFECLVKIMTLYYEKMAFYMERALFGVRQIYLIAHTLY